LTAMRRIVSLASWESVRPSIFTHGFYRRNPELYP